MAECVLGQLEDRQPYDALERFLDPDTIDQLERLGVGAGWHRLEWDGWRVHRGVLVSVIATDV